MEIPEIGRLNFTHVFSTWIIGSYTDGAEEYAYKLGFYYEGPNISDISASSITMTAITTGYTDTAGTITIGAFNTVSFAIVAGSETVIDSTQTINYQLSWLNEIIPQNTEQNFTVVGGSKVSEDFSGTCTTNLGVSLTYTMKANGDYPMPDWISLNESEGKYTGVAPWVKAETIFSFILESTWTGQYADSESQVVNVVVNSGPQSLSLQNAIASSAAMVAAGAAVGVAISMISGNRPTCLYFVLHQLQMIILLMMIDPFIPAAIKDYLKSQGFVLVTFNFIPSGDIPGIDIPVEWMDEEQTNNILESLGIESKSTFINNLSLVVSMTCILILHFLLRFVLICGLRSVNQSRLATFWNWLRLKFIDMIKYAVYMRLMIESHEAMLLSATSEIKLMEINATSDVFSIVIAFAVFGLSLAMPAIAFYSFFVNRHNFDPERKFFFMEFFADLRNAKIARLYMTLLLSRRILFVILIIFFPSAPRELTYTIILGILHNLPYLVSQFLYISALLVMRPFDTNMNNIIEIVNELFLFIVA